MNTPHIPRGFTALTPYLIVSDAERLIQFLREVFDAEEVIVVKSPEGKINHAAYNIGGAVVELSTAQGDWAPLAAGLHVYVPDTDATYKPAIAAGGKSLYEPADMFYGERSGGVQDAFGNQWYIATKTEDLSDEEIQRRVASHQPKN